MPKPIPATYEQVADLLLDMSQRVRSGDSWEGHISYQVDYATLDPLVECAYRIGNREGDQGGMRMVGDLT